MSLIPGKYQHYKSENIDNYFSAIGVPYIGRKIIGMSSPLLEITLEGDRMSVKTSSFYTTLESSFKLDEEYDEKMPTQLLKSKTTLINNREFETKSVSPKGLKHSRHFLCTEDECLIILSHEQSNITAKRYFRRVK